MNLWSQYFAQKYYLIQMKNEKQIKHISLPAEGFAGLKQNFSSDFMSGFFIFLLALPLSLGISKASEFPAIMGLITAMIGGVVVSWIAGSRLTIKGPAAGLIVIVAGAVAEFGKGDALLGWKLALGAIFVASIIQILFGLIRLGSLVDFFPLSAIHGMLAAIGIIIISKQAHQIFGVTPKDSLGHVLSEPIDLIRAIPKSMILADHNSLIIGVVSLLIVFLWPLVKHPILKKVPSPILVLGVAIPLSKGIHLDPKYLIHFGDDLIHTLKINIQFGGMTETGTFIKYVLMFALVGSLESLLTVKAVDAMDPFRRKSNANKDLIAVGIGNMISSILGGLPMISEVARSSANVNNGAKTRFANFWHGALMLLFLLFDLEFSDLIPQGALAALLIGVGVKLASPKEFGRMAKIGPEQLAVFITTIVVTLLTDLLLGIFAGIVIKIILQTILGAPLKSAFKLDYEQRGNVLYVKKAAVFSNWLKLNKIIARFNQKDIYKLDFSQCRIIDHTVQENLHHLIREFENSGGLLEVTGVDDMKYTSKSKHHMSTRYRSRRTVVSQ